MGMFPALDIPEIHLFTVAVGSLLAVEAAVTLLILSRFGGEVARSVGNGVGSVDPDDAARDPDADAGCPETDDDLPSGVDPDADLVVCRDCGTPNERGYRFCRQCVSELAGGFDVPTAPRSRFDRRTP